MKAVTQQDGSVVWIVDGWNYEQNCWDELANPQPAEKPMKPGGVFKK